MKAKPSLGYASRTAAIIALRAQHHSTREIADRLGISINAVSGLEHSARRARDEAPTEHSRRAIVLPFEVLRGLRPHAVKRGMSVNQLARRIVEQAVDDGIVDAIMDDAEAIS